MKRYYIKNKSVFFRFWLPYIIILCIPIILGTFTYQEALKIVEQDTVNNNIALLEQTRDILDDRLSEVDTLVTQLSLNNKIKNIQFIKHTPQGKDMYKIYQANKEISAYKLINNFIKDFHIYFKDSGIILTPNTSYINLQILYGYIFKYGELTYHEWRDNILGKYYQKEYFAAVPTTFNGKKSNVITYAQSLPYEYDSKGNGTVFCYIDESEIHNLLQKLQIGSGGWAYIIDKNGNILTSVGKNPQEIIAVDIPVDQKSGVVQDFIYGHDMIVSYTNSSYNQWTYVAVLPVEVILAKMNYIKNLFMISTLFILVIGLLGTYYMAERSSKPVEHALEALAKNLTYHYRRGNIYDFLTNNIINLIYSNKNLRDVMDQQVPLLKSAFFDRLLNGSFDDLEGMDELINKIEFYNEGNMYLVILIQIYGSERIVSLQALKDLNSQKNTIKEVFYDIVGNNGYIHEMGTNQLALVLAFSKEEANYREFVESLIQKIKAKVFQKHQIQIRCAAGDAYDDLFDIVQSFNEAKQTMDANRYLDKEDIVLWYGVEKSDSSYAYYYPVEIEMKLINFVKAGDIERTMKLLDTIFVENFLRRDLPSLMKDQFFYELKNTIIKILNQIKVDEDNMFRSIDRWFYELDNCQIVNQAYELIIGFFSDICNTVNNIKKSHNTNLIMQIVEYINMNFTDSNLSLSNVAANFNVTEAYLSQFFKEQTGENFSTYLERKRIEYADQLLLDGSMTVSEIARSSGYNSANTFRRAYKRYYGIRPTERKKVSSSKTVSEQ